MKQALIAGVVALVMANSAVAAFTPGAMKLDNGGPAAPSFTGPHGGYQETVTFRWALATGGNPYWASATFDSADFFRLSLASFKLECGATYTGPASILLEARTDLGWQMISLGANFIGDRVTPSPGGAAVFQPGALIDALGPGKYRISVIAGSTATPTAGAAVLGLATGMSAVPEITSIGVWGLAGVAGTAVVRHRRR